MSIGPDQRGAGFAGTDSRRIIVSAWNVGEIERMAPPPLLCVLPFTSLMPAE